MAINEQQSSALAARYATASQETARRHQEADAQHEGRAQDTNWRNSPYALRRNGDGFQRIGLCIRDDIGNQARAAAEHDGEKLNRWINNLILAALTNPEKIEEYHQAHEEFMQNLVRTRAQETEGKRKLLAFWYDYYGHHFNGQLSINNSDWTVWGIMHIQNPERVIEIKGNKIVSNGTETLKTVAEISAQMKNAEMQCRWRYSPDWRQS